MRTSLRFLLPAMLLACAAAKTTAQDPVDARGARAALAAVPAKFQSGIVKLSADNGNPNPPEWYIVAKTQDGVVYSLTISAGQVVSEKPSLNLRALVTDPSPIDVSRVAVGSEGAWQAAEKYSLSKGKTLGSVSYALQQKGRDAAPIWSVWCYGPGGGYIGLLEILATTGAVVSSE
ncbi:MAG TPA: hypothetical protein PLS03_16615 [Terrimicrobiaceae bacterium]|nr:hypothetical protein [Terrimicrobiaceae bacterium]